MKRFSDFLTESPQMFAALQQIVCTLVKHCNNGHLDAEGQQALNELCDFMQVDPQNPQPRGWRPPGM